MAISVSHRLIISWYWYCSTSWWSQSQLGTLHKISRCTFDFYGISSNILKLMLVVNHAANNVEKYVEIWIDSSGWSRDFYMWDIKKKHASNSWYITISFSMWIFLSLRIHELSFCFCLQRIFTSQFLRDKIWANEKSSASVITYISHNSGSSLTTCIFN